MAGDARIQVLINDDVDCNGRRQQGLGREPRTRTPTTEYRLMAQTEHAARHPWWMPRLPAAGVPRGLART